MPGKAKARGQGAPGAQVVVAGPATAAPAAENAEHYTKVREALDIIAGCAAFHDIQASDPLPVSADSGEGGVQAPFNQVQFERALSTQGRYIAGCNLFWLNMLFTPTPHVPVRRQAVDSLVEHFFKEPAPIDGVTVSVFDAIKVAGHKGALEACSPEELRHAALFAMARDVKAERAEAIATWRRLALSTSVTFVKHRDADERYWAALQQRENLAQSSEAMSRTAIQRIYEIGRFRNQQRQLHGSAKASAAAIFDAFNSKLTLARTSQQLSKSIVDMALTIYDRLLSTPELTEVLLIADSGPKHLNPFDSVTKLQILIQKTKSTANLVWCVRHLWHMCRHQGLAPKSVTVDALRGSAAGKGLVDLWLLKRDLFDLLVDQVPRRCHLDPEWFHEVVRPKMATHAAWQEHCSNQGNNSWQAGQPKHVVTYVTLVSEAVYGTAYDVVLRAMLKQGLAADTVESQSGIAEVLATVTEAAKPADARTAEETLGHDAPQGGPDGDDDGETVTLIVQVPAGSGAGSGTATTSEQQHQVTKVALSELGEEEREKVVRAKRNMESLVRANVQLLVKDKPDLRAELLTTSAGKAKGGPDAASAGAWKYVLIVLDTKVMGEANSRPRFRLPPVSADEVKKLLEVARGRHSPAPPPDANPEQLEEAAALQPGDMFALLDGGRAVDSQLMAAFAGKTKECRQCFVLVEQASLQARYDRVRLGFSVHNQIESARLVTASVPTLARRTRLHYPGDNTGNVIGPVVLPAWGQQWNTTYQEKKQIYGANFIAVGGKGSKHERALVESTEGEDEKRTNATVEPVFFHALPEPFWAELINSCSATAVLDLTASDESLPLACLRAHVPYTGICMTAAHVAALWRRLNLRALSAAADEGDALYDCDLATGLKRKAAQEGAEPAPKKKAKSKAKSQAKSKAKAKAKQNGADGVDGAGDADEEEDPFGSDAGDEADDGAN